MALFPVADTTTCRFPDPWSDRAGPVRARARRTDVVWWWRTTLLTVRPTAGLPTPSDDDHHFHHHQARRPRIRPQARPASAAWCIRRAAARRNSRWTVAAFAERGPPPAASRFT